MGKYSNIKRRIIFFRSSAWVLSALLHPLGMLTYLFLILSAYAPLSLAPLNSEGGRNYLLIVICISTLVLPLFVLTIYQTMMKRRLRWKDFQMEDSRERVLPFMGVGALYASLSYMLGKHPQFNENVIGILSATSICILLISLISNYWKISAHAAGMAGMLGFLIVLNRTSPDARLFYPILAVILVSGLLLSARMYLQAHDLRQILAGLLLGLIVCAGTLTLIHYFFV